MRRFNSHAELHRVSEAFVSSNIGCHCYLHLFKTRAVNGTLVDAQNRSALGLQFARYKYAKTLTKHLGIRENAPPITTRRTPKAAVPRACSPSPPPWDGPHYWPSLVRASNEDSNGFNQFWLVTTNCGRSTVLSNPRVKTRWRNMNTFRALPCLWIMRQLESWVLV
ncbi:hypothetical protein K431DRAFT_89757 [Polychaeton citri CBS 116435]|uniref:Uncharacterized protein n=1 Tax=Polychaeton citri CBS 116435 TaxID=1314669 RepID=A0A9P4UNC9_9PEZI|nr:hypothetical protein K431DRAFT_89757 [Polychaeton citri CBS 116435]